MTPPVALARPRAEAADALAELHRSAFSAASAWSARDFAELLEDPATIWATAWDQPQIGAAMALFRVASLEAELLTLVCAPARRRQGLGAAVLNAGLGAIHAVGVRELFLEVAESNTPARALYAKFNFEAVGRRVGYFRSGENALVLRRGL